MLGIIIPTYNEKENIFKLSNRLIKLYPNSKIFIVDDTKNYNLNDITNNNDSLYYVICIALGYIGKKTNIYKFVFLRFF